MIRLHELIPKISPETRMILQVHDELVFEVPEHDAHKIAKVVKETMEGVYKLKVPIVVEVEVGRSWGETNGVEV
jgi:DNA polymerase-1